MNMLFRTVTGITAMNDGGQGAIPSTVHAPETSETNHNDDITADAHSY